MEDAKRTFIKIHRKIDEATQFLKDSLEELRQFDTLGDDKIFVENLIEAADTDDYDRIVIILDALYKKQKRRFSFK